MKGNNGKSEWENENDRLKRTKKCDYAIVFQIREEIELSKQKTEVITWAWPLPIGYCLPLLHYPTIAMSRIKSLFFLR